MTTTPGPGVRTAEPWKALARRATAWSAGTALVLLVASAVVVLTWRDDLPDPVASHWGAGAEPNGFQSLAAWLTTMLVSGLACVVLLGAIGWFWGKAAMTRRTAAAATVWIGGFFATLNVVSLASQRGLADATQARSPSWHMVVSWLVPLVPAVLAALLAPADPRQAATEPVPADAERVALADGERAVWIRRIGGGTGLWVGAGSIVLVLALALLTRQWGMLVIPVLLAALFAAMMVFEVRVDASGLRVRSALGWPRTFVPADEVVQARVVEVFALRQFGGWGWRVRPGGEVGIVPRSGQGIEVERTGGRIVTITVDDAESGAALLNMMADRAR
jgi:hypothetical protein